MRSEPMPPSVPPRRIALPSPRGPALALLVEALIDLDQRGELAAAAYVDMALHALSGANRQNS